jgi:integrase
MTLDTYGHVLAGSPKGAADKLDKLFAPPLQFGGHLGVKEATIATAGAFRRSELVSFDVGEGRLIGVPYGSNVVTCPVRAMQAWLEASTIVDGPLFRSIDRGGHTGSTRLAPQVVALIVKRRAQRVGFDPARVAGHSLRAGFATSAALAGVDALEISRQTGHRNLSMVQRYTRPATIWQMNAAQRVGL